MKDILTNKKKKENLTFCQSSPKPSFNENVIRNLKDSMKLLDKSYFLSFVDAFHIGTVNLYLKKKIYLLVCEKVALGTGQSHSREHFFWINICTGL